MKITLNVPDSLAPYAEDIGYFVETMCRKLHTNRHKGFEKIPGSINNLLNGLRGEVSEIEEAIENESQFDVALEAADVANFSLLLAITVWQLTRKDYDNQVKKALTQATQLGDGV